MTGWIPYLKLDELKLAKADVVIIIKSQIRISLNQDLEELARLFQSEMPMTSQNMHWYSSLQISLLLKRREHAQLVPKRGQNR